MNANELTTDRLVLRPFKASDAMDLYEYLSDPEVTSFEPYDPFTLDESRQEAEHRSKNPNFWAVCLKDSGKVIGNLYFEGQDFETYEIGFVFNRNYQKQGYALESCKAMLEYAFRTLHARRIIAYCSTANKNSWNLMERLGMRREGCFLQNVTFKKDKDGNPIYFDSYEYAILKQEYK